MQVASCLLAACRLLRGNLRRFSLSAMRAMQQQQQRRRRPPWLFVVIVAAAATAAAVSRDNCKIVASLSWTSTCRALPLGQVGSHRHTCRAYPKSFCNWLTIVAVASASASSVVVLFIFGSQKAIRLGHATRTVLWVAICLSLSLSLPLCGSGPGSLSKETHPNGQVYFKFRGQFA